MHYTIYTTQYTLYIIQYTYCAIYSISYTMYTIQYTLYTIQYTIYIYHLCGNIIFVIVCCFNHHLQQGQCITYLMSFPKRTNCRYLKRCSFCFPVIICIICYYILLYVIICYYMLVRQKQVGIKNSARTLSV